MKLWRGLTAVQQQHVRNAEIVSYTRALLEIGGDFIVTITQSGSGSRSLRVRWSACRLRGFLESLFFMTL
jgi:hypothetical protein